jgi:tRNA pseudouridine38-40 synthase
MHRPDPMVARFGTFIERSVNLELLKKALDVFVGSHDFRAFCKEQPYKPTLKTIDAIELKPCQKTGGFTIMIKGKSFLRFMIRRIVGAALAAATKPTVSLDDLKKALFEKKMIKVLPTAPAQGLCLMQIDYYSKMEGLI